MRNRESIIFTQEELSTEEWKDIIGYDYEYQISDLGRLKRVTSFHKNKENTITLGSFDSDGYLRIGLVKDGKSIGKKLHRLVGEYFIEGYCEELTINHIDFVKNNNRKVNLELMTSAENALDYVIKVKKESSSSNCLGVGYHKQLDKWTTRINIEGHRKSLGVFDTKEDAECAIQNYKEGDIKQGKGLQNKGIRKYTQENVVEIIESLSKIGFRKTRRLFNIGSSTLNLIRDNKYYETRD